MRYLWRLALVLVVAVATVVLLIDRNDRSADDDRKIPDPWPVVAIGSLAGMAFVENVRAIVSEVRAEDKATFRRDMENILSGTLVTVYKRSDALAPTTEWYLIGLHVWLVPRWYRSITPRHTLRRKVPSRLRQHLRSPRATPELKRYGKIRLVDKHPEPSGISWRRGRGVLGKAWDERSRVFFNSELQWEPYRGCTRAEWEDPKNTVHMNLPYKDFKRLEPRYGQVIAVPIRKKRNDHDEYPEVIGCIAFDTPLGRHEASEIIEDNIIPALLEAATKVASSAR